MSTAVIKRKFEVNVTEKINILCDGSGVLKETDRKIHLHRHPVIAVSAAAARSKCERKLTKEMEDAVAEAFIDRLEVDVTDVTFQG